MLQRGSGRGVDNRILYLVISLAYGGAEVQVVELAAAMRERGWDPLLVGMGPPAGLESRVEALGLPHTHLGVPVGRKSPRLLSRFVRACAAFDPAVLHTHTLPPNFLGRAARPLCRVPVLISSAHSVYEGGRGRMAFYRLTDSLADLTTNVSPAAVQRYVQIGAVPSERRIRYVPNGIDLARFAPDRSVRASVRGALGVEEQTFLWLAVGTHREPKDYPNLLRALSAMEPGDWTVLIAGDGPLREAHEAMVEALGLQGRVRLLGNRTDVVDLMKGADGYVMSSAWEGLPIVLLEAAASELPIVATDVGGNAEIVVDGQSGFLVPARDHRALADQLRAVMAAPAAQRLVWGGAGRRRVAERFGMEAIADQWDAIYRQLLREPSRFRRAG